MRFSFIVGAGVVVAIVALVVVLSFSWDQPTNVVEETPQPTGGLIEQTDNSQYLQAIPEDASALPVSSPVASTTPAETASMEGTTKVIALSEEGFSPATVTVAAGTTVNFVNNGQADHWPASDVHPTHQALPGFDAKRGLATGETYSYTFTKVGTWQCHDHLMPQHTCTVVVQ